MTTSSKGRVDLLLDGLIEYYVQTQPNPAIEVAYNRARPVVRETLEDLVGPKTRVGRKAKRVIEQAGEIAHEVKRVRARRAGQ